MSRVETLKCDGCGETVAPGSSDVGKLTVGGGRSGDELDLCPGCVAGVRRFLQDHRAPAPPPRPTRTLTPAAAARLDNMLTERRAKAPSVTGADLDKFEKAGPIADFVSVQREPAGEWPTRFFRMDGDVHVFGDCCQDEDRSEIMACSKCKRRAHFQAVYGGYFTKCEICDEAEAVQSEASR